MDGQAVISALGDRAEGLGGLRFGLIPAAEQSAAVVARDRLGRDITGLATRMSTPNAPLLVVIGGVTGGGKSMLVNTLVGRVVTTTGVRQRAAIEPVGLASFPDVLVHEGRIEVNGRRRSSAWSHLPVPQRRRCSAWLAAQLL